MSGSAPHEKVNMPVVFYVDPAFGTDADMRDIAQLTLGYTFFRSVDPQNAKDLSRYLANNPPDPAYGRELFNEQCIACHGRGRLGLVISRARRPRSSSSGPAREDKLRPPRELLRCL
ncbi:MAG: cytochrome c oxidase assembly protein [Xanthobacteraceae bacterium]